MTLPAAFRPDAKKHADLTLASIAEPLAILHDNTVARANQAPVAMARNWSQRVPLAALRGVDWDDGNPRLRCCPGRSLGARNCDRAATRHRRSLC